jgi:hypothetical protein
MIVANEELVVADESGVVEVSPGTAGKHAVHRVPATQKCLVAVLIA